MIDGGCDFLFLLFGFWFWGLFLGAPSFGESRGVQLFVRLNRGEKWSFFAVWWNGSNRAFCFKKKKKKRKRRVRLYWVELRVCGHLGLFILLALSLSSPGVVAVFFFFERATSWDYAFWLFLILYFGCVLMKRGFHLWALLLWPFTWRVKLSDSMAWLCFVVNASGTCSCTYSVVLWSSGPLFGCLEVWFCAYPVFAHLIGFLISLLAFEEAFSQLG